MRKAAGNILLIIGVLTSVGTATIIHIPQDQPTIQAGIDSAVDGDTVLVDTGRYVENINFNGKNLVLGSWFLLFGETSYISNTVIDGDSAGSVVTIESGESSGTRLSGFTLTHGSSVNGGGVFIENSSPTLTHLKIIENYTSGGMGGGIYCSYSSPLVEDCLISENSSYPGPTDAGGVGGGLGCEYSNPILRRVVISKNKSIVFGHGSGGGIWLFHSNPLFQYVTIADNIAHNNGRGAGVAMYFSNPVFMNLTMANNENEGEYPADGMYIASGHLFLMNSIVWGDSISSDCNLSLGSQTLTVAYSDLIGGQSNIQFPDIGACTVYWEQGNTDDDPLFVDPEDGDFHLQQGSPCIDAGTPFFLWQGDTLLDLPDTAYEGNAPDMGAFESPFSVGIVDEDFVPVKYSLRQNYPNPFNTETVIRYDLPTPSFVTLEIYNLLGQRVRTLVAEWRGVGSYQSRWHGVDDAGSAVTSGVYLYRVKAANWTQIRKAVLMR